MHRLAALPSSPPSLGVLMPWGWASGLTGHRTCRKPQEPQASSAEVACHKRRPATDILQSILLGARPPELCWEMEPLPLKPWPDSSDAYL